ncbi:MAG: D-glycero-beta-D-manno-heptose-7-phosphate kinase [Candidatus Margulisiibacteriota bacterium]
MNIASLISKKPKILVVGDFILDQYYWTNVTRISPEAPVPVCHIQETTHSLGGAGNVAHNLSVFGTEVHLAGVIGNDENGTRLCERFNDLGMNIDLLIKSDDYPTICKTRVMAKGQQLCRLDFEDPKVEIDKHLNSIMKIVNNSNISNFDGIALSDYNKGTLTPNLCQALIQLGNQHQIPIIIDPKGHDATKYFGATYITPNIKEFMDLTGLNSILDETEVIESGQQLMQQNKINNIIFTRSESGITLMANNQIKNYPTKVIRVSDVTGAGDTVVAAVAFGASQQWSIDQIINFANLAAGVVVSKVGTATASITEIETHGTHFQ